MGRNDEQSSEGIVHATIGGVDVRLSTESGDKDRSPSGIVDRYPDEVLENIFVEIGENDVFFEIGASTGVFSCVVGRKYPGIDIVCFEPHPRTRERLNRNLRLNGIDATVMDCAISDSDEPGAFVRTLDGVVGGDVPSPTVVMSDIVGEEANLLRGGATTFSSPTTRVAYIVTHDQALERLRSNRQAVEEFLREYGFDEVEHLRENLLKATKSNPTE